MGLLPMSMRPIGIHLMGIYLIAMTGGRCPRRDEYEAMEVAPRRRKERAKGDREGDIALCKRELVR
jgi:hypothetical protein